MTGQYSRLGALLDPLVDRLLVLSGVIVCWHFELLPRWALALLAARELFDARRSCATRMRHGVDLKINWLGPRGRLAGHVGALFFAHVRRATGWRSRALYVGLVLALGVGRAVRSGWAAAARAQTPQPELERSLCLPPSRRPRRGLAS